MNATPTPSSSPYLAGCALSWLSPGAVQGEDHHKADGQGAGNGADQEHTHLGRAEVAVSERLGRLAPGGHPADPPPGVPARLHRHLRDTGQPTQAHEIAQHIDLGVAGDGQVLADLDASGVVTVRAGRAGDSLGQGRCLHTSGPQHGAGRVPADRAVGAARQQPAGVHPGHDRAHVLPDPQLPQVTGHLRRKNGAKRCQRRIAAIEQQDPCLPRLDMAELGAQRPGRQFADLPGQLHPGRPGTDQREREPAGPLRGVAGRLGHLERPEHAAPDGQRVSQRLHAGREGGELVVPEVGLLHAGGHDQEVIAVLGLAAERPGGQHAAAPGIDTGHLRQFAVDVAVVPEQVAQRSGDLSLGQDAGRALVQQRLEQVVLGAADEGHLDRRAPQRPDGEQAGEAPPTITTRGGPGWLPAGLGRPCGGPG